MVLNDAQSAENRLDKHCPVADVPRSALHCYFRPETEEFVFLAGQSAGAFESHWRGMRGCMNELHQAQTRYSSLLEHYAQAAKDGSMSAQDMNKRLKAIEDAEVEQEKKREAVKQKLGSLSEEGVGYDEVVELIPISGQRGSKQRGDKSPALVYVKKGFYTTYKEGRQLHAVQLKPADMRGGQDSIFSRNKHRQVLIDTGRLARQLKALEIPALKLELQSVLDWTGLDVDLASLTQDKTLFEWAQCWNETLQSERQLSPGVDASGAAQFMRYTSNVGASVEFDIRTLQAAVQAEFKRTLTVASGYADIQRYLPDLHGWPLKLQVRQDKTLHLGNLRLRVGGQVNGFLGASLQLESQVQVMLRGDQQLIAGQPGGRLPRFRTRRATGLEFHQAMEAEDEGIKLTGEAFAGARVELGLKGAVQWLKPTSPHSGFEKQSDTAASHVGEYVDLCSIGSSIAGMAGIGAGGKFFCTFLNGRWCFHIAASLCCGPGAKGGFIAEVGARDIAEFGAWVAYQLYTLDYGFMDFMSEYAYRAYGYFRVLQMITGHGHAYLGSQWEFNTFKQLFEKLKALVANIQEETGNLLAKSSARNQLAVNVNNMKAELLACTPESKGILLYLLTRHGTFDHVDPGSRSMDGDIYHERKIAVICILTSIQTVSEWHSVMCRMTADGSKLSGSGFQTTKKQEQHLVRFLQEGKNVDDALTQHKFNIEIIFNRLKTEPAVGYALAMNDSQFYDLHCTSNPHFPDRCNVGPSAEGEWLS